MPVSRPPETTGDPRVPVTLALLVLVGAFLLWRELRRPEPPLHDLTEPRREVEVRGELETEEEINIEIFRRVSPSVVHVAASEVPRPYSLDPNETPTGTGTGFVWSDEGYIVTNAHLVERGDTWRVTLVDLRTFPARLVGVHREYDIAVLKIEAAPNVLHPIPLGSSYDLRVGQRVLAIGNPFGLDRTLTTGVIGGLGRRVTTDRGTEIYNLIQTDAAINPGNSGGPLLDSAGRMIGMNTAIVSDHFGSSGIGLAIPVDVVNSTVPFLIRAGRSVPEASRAGLGVSVMTESFSSALGIDGAVIEEVLPDSGAARAGLRSLVKRDDGTFEMDVITEVAGKRIRNQFDLGEALRMRAPMDVVEVRILRDGRPETVRVKLTEID